MTTYEAEILTVIVIASIIVFISFYAILEVIKKD